METEKKVEDDKVMQEIKNNSVDYVENVLKSTVGISLLKPDNTSVFDINMEENWGLGTGIIVSPSGYILTNQHLRSVYHL
jgi:S1-C subfamily serine protease